MSDHDDIDAPATTSIDLVDGAKLLLIDGHSMAYRAFFALPVENFATTDGQPTNAVYGFTSMLINLVRDEKPTHVFVAWDRSGPTFRTEQYPEYKGTRSASPDEFRGQVALIQEVLGALTVPHLGIEGIEADDVLATIATRAQERGAEVLICSGDRDTFQLVTDRVTVLYPRKGVSDLARMTPEAVEEKYGVPPERYPDLAALVGETSDNLPGVPGVGPKTAAKWITAYDGLQNVVASADQIKGKAGRTSAPTSPRWSPTVRSTDCCATSTSPSRSRTSRGRPSTARRSTRSSTRCSSGCCATGCCRCSPRTTPRPSRWRASR
ncbi:hypothetical protein GCM10025875_11380 [Litorihabitans aurantiacus]|uniref:5'-3' exonuclease n=1 Tax=Litorihabitans aurantiacus TaxID=1930061 RepID=A0AA37UVB5_9MICO|nr:hypothetical protein GCM10025875_11380 [Litorihabitans aurantiacus]